MGAIDPTVIERIAVFRTALPGTLKLGRYAASRTSFTADPDGYGYSRPEERWNYQPTWLCRRDGRPGRFVQLADVRDDGLTWARQRRLIADGPGYSIIYKQDRGYYEFLTFDRDEAERMLAVWPGSRLEQLPMPHPSERFAARLEFDFERPIVELEIVEAAAVGLWLAAHHPSVDGILCDPDRIEGDNPFVCGSLVMGRRDHWEETDAPVTSVDTEQDQRF